MREDLDAEVQAELLAMRLAVTMMASELQRITGFDLARALRGAASAFDATIESPEAFDRHTITKLLDLAAQCERRWPAYRSAAAQADGGPPEAG